MALRRIVVPVMALTLSAAGFAEGAVDERRASLKGSRASMREQNGVAKDKGLSFFGTAEEVREAADRGDLVELSGNDDYDVADFVSHPYAIPAVRTFVERLSSQYREACGQKLVVTSATRASSKQPSNASKLSVHPAGMAVDLRVSDDASCREWLESSVLGMERRGVIDAIREYHPPHYHVAIYPEPYLAYVDERIAAERAEAAKAEAEAEAANAEVEAAKRDPATSPTTDAGASGAEAAARSEAAPSGGDGVLLALLLIGTALVAGAVASRRVWLPHARERIPYANSVGRYASAVGRCANVIGRWSVDALRAMASELRSVAESIRTGVDDLLNGRLDRKQS